MEIAKVTTSQKHGFSVGEKVSIPIKNGFWKTFFHWLFRQNLKRTDIKIIADVTETTFTMEIGNENN